jgi:hypothetical protein
MMMMMMMMVMVMVMVMVIRKVVTLYPEMLLSATLNVYAPGNAQTSMQTYMPKQQ